MSAALSPPPSSGYSNFTSLSGRVQNTDEIQDALVQLYCQTENGLPLLHERAKQTVLSCKDLVAFLRKRSAIEEEYGRSLMKLASQSTEYLSRSDRKEFTYQSSLAAIMQADETIGENHLRLSSALSDIAEGLASLLKDTDRARRNLRDMSNRFERILDDAEAAAEKARHKYDVYSEEWERMLLQRNANDTSPRKAATNPLARLKARTPQMLNKAEEDARAKAELANEQYKTQLLLANNARQEYFKTNLPLIIQALLETLEECDYGMQYFLAKYAFTLESLQLSDASTITPLQEQGLRAKIDQIDVKHDLKRFATEKSIYGCKPRSQDEIPYTEYPLSEEARSILNPKRVFGVDLATQLQRDKREVPLVMTKCIEAVERHGLMSEGIYRISGSVTQLKLLKAEMNKDCDAVTLGEEELVFDINSIAGLLKLYLRELPEPLLTKKLSDAFVEAAAEENIPRLQQCVQQLPPANRNTLRCLIKHLCRVRDYEAYNRMNANNIAIVFGPSITVEDPSLNPMVDMARRSRVVELMIIHYSRIFT